MVIFKELRVTNDAKTLVINTRVREESYYKDVYIDKVIIDTEETYKEGGPSSNPIYSTTIEGNQKEISLGLSIYQITQLHEFNNHLLFVYVVTKGNPTSNVPCGLDNKTTLGVTTYLGDFYNSFMGHIKEINNNCSIPQGLIDLILRWMAIKVSINSGHNIQGIKYFEKWFSDKIILPSVNCGCNG